MSEPTPGRTMRKSMNGDSYEPPTPIEAKGAVASEDDGQSGATDAAVSGVALVSNPIRGVPEGQVKSIPPPPPLPEGERMKSLKNLFKVGGATAAAAAHKSSSSDATKPVEAAAPPSLTYGCDGTIEQADELPARTMLPPPEDLAPESKAGRRDNALTYGDGTIEQADEVSARTMLPPPENLAPGSKAWRGDNDVTPPSLVAEAAAVSMVSNPVRGAPPEQIKSIPPPAPLDEETIRKRRTQYRKCAFMLAFVIILVVLIVGLSVGFTAKQQDVATAASTGTEAASAATDTSSPTKAPAVTPTSMDATDAPTPKQTNPITGSSSPTKAPVMIPTHIATSQPVFSAHDTNPPTQAPIPDRTPSQTTPPTALSSFLQLRNYLSSVSPDGGAALQDPSNPQFSALTWLSDNPLLSTYSNAQINQRYALATLYYSTGGQNWTNSEGWLEPETPECSWADIECVDSPIPGPMLRRRAQNETVLVVRELKLFDLNLVGTLPSELALLPEMLKLYLWGNGLIGKIPSELGQVSGLKVLELDGNQMTGTIPVELYGLTDLTNFRLEKNLLSGSIATEVGQLTLLEKFRADINKLEGALPEEMGDLISLKELRLNGNNFTGTVPDTMGNLQAIAKVFLHDTSLGGEMPPSVCNLRQEALTDLTSDCGGSDPEIICTCCSECYPNIFGGKRT